MLADYDDWYLEKAPCSKESSHRSPWRSSGGSTRESRARRARSTATLILLFFAVLVLGFASGCGNNRTVFVPEDSPMRLGPNSSARVWVRVNGQWELSANRINIPEGWYIVPSSYVDEEQP